MIRHVSNEFAIYFFFSPSHPNIKKEADARHVSMPRGLLGTPGLEWDGVSIVAGRTTNFATTKKVCCLASKVQRLKTILAKSTIAPLAFEIYPVVKDTSYCTRPLSPFLEFTRSTVPGGDRL